MVTEETTPDDIQGIHASVGILTSTGGLTSHAAVVARGMNKTCVVGAADVDAKKFTFNGNTVHPGKKITINGKTGEVWMGTVPTIQDNGQYYVDLLKELFGIGNVSRTQYITSTKDVVDFNGDTNVLLKVKGLRQDALVDLINLCGSHKNEFQLDLSWYAESEDLVTLMSPDLKQNYKNALTVADPQYPVMVLGVPLPTLCNSNINTVPTLTTWEEVIDFTGSRAIISFESETLDKLLTFREKAGHGIDQYDDQGTLETLLYKSLK